MENHTLSTIYKAPASSSHGGEAEGKSDIHNDMDNPQMHFNAIKKPDPKDNLISLAGHSYRTG